MKVISFSIEVQIQLAFVAPVVCPSLNFLHNPAIIAVLPIG